MGLFYNQGFTGLSVARDWVQFFVDWYNNEHLHSAIKFITPVQHLAGKDEEILTNCKEVYKQEKSKNPNRWKGGIRIWDAIKRSVLKSRKSSR